MKKFLAIIMCLAMFICVAGCSKSNNSSDNESDYEWIYEEVDDETADNDSENKDGKSTKNNTSTKKKTGNNSTTSGGNAAGYVTSKGNYGKGLKMKNLKNPKITIMGTPTTLKALQQNDKAKAPYTSYQVWLSWKQTYGVDLTFVAMEESDLVAAYAANNMPDIISVPFSNMSMAMDLSNVLDFNDNLYTKEYNDFIEWTGKKWNAVGTKRLQRKYIIFNETAFKEAGEKTPLQWYNEGKWTFTQFKATAKAMTDAKNDAFGITGNEVDARLIPYNVVKWDAKGRLSSNLSDTNLIKAATELRNIYKVDGSVRNDSKMMNWRNEFYKSKDAMLIGNEYEFSELCYKSKMNGGVDIGVAPMFTWDITGETKPYYATSSMASSISAKCKNLEAAIEYLRLTCYVNQQMIERDGLFGSAEQYLTKAEREALVKAEKGTIIKNPGDYLCMRSLYGVTGQLLNMNSEGGILSTMATYEPELQQLLKEYNSKIK